MEQQATLQGDQAPAFRLEKFWLPGLVALGVILAAVIAGLAIGPGGNSIIGQFLTASSDSTGTLSNIGLWLPFGFAFAAGMVATVNPCGFGMLPAYLAMYVGEGDGQESAVDGATARRLSYFIVPVIAWGAVRGAFWLFFDPPFIISFLLILSALLYGVVLLVLALMNYQRIWDGIQARMQDPGKLLESRWRDLAQQVVKALYVSAALGLGFVILFGTVGFTISAGARSVSSVFPWLSFTLGFVMTLLGAYLFAGGKLYTGAAQSAASKIGDPRDQSLRGYFLFGLSYATASLSCTLPIFLSIVTTSLASDGVIGAAGQFLAYAGGMAFVIAVLTISIAVFKGALVNQFRRIMPYLSFISAGILIIVGGYLIFYWLTEGGLATNFGVS